MTGCGIRPLRWGLESINLGVKTRNLGKKIEFWVNDANISQSDLIKRNLKGLENLGISLNIRNERAEALLCKAFLEKKFFDIIDLDCFGSPNYLLQPIINVLAFEGILIVTSTDGRSSTGHERSTGIRNYGASTRTHPSSWEIALRLQLAAIAKQAWLLGRGIEPLINFSDGRTFRTFVRLKRNLAIGEENELGLLARCESCGDQYSQSLIRLKAWRKCHCQSKSSQWKFFGPLWLGPLQSLQTLDQLKSLEECLKLPITNKSKKLLKKLSEDEGIPLFCWSTAEITSRLSLRSTPPLHQSLKALREKGFKAFSSGIMPGQIRTNATIDELLKIFAETWVEGH